MGANPYPPSDKYDPEEYNPMQSTETWEHEPSWNDVQSAADLDTPESPPMFEKEGYSDPVEYHDSTIHSGIEDVDHRVIPSIDDEGDMGKFGILIVLFGFLVLAGKIVKYERFCNKFY